MSVLFIAPDHIASPHWLGAFPSAQVAPVLELGDSPALVWLLLQGEASFTQIDQLSQRAIPVIAMTAMEQTQEARRVLSAGASGYVHYLAVPSVLQHIAQAVADGSVWLGAELMRELILGAKPQPSALPPAQLDRLTGRERAVAELVAAGKTNKEVARALDITERTVKAHLGASFEKLGVRDRLQLVLALSGKQSI